MNKQLLLFSLALIAFNMVNLTNSQQSPCDETFGEPFGDDCLLLENPKLHEQDQALKEKVFKEFDHILGDYLKTDKGKLELSSGTIQKNQVLLKKLRDSIAKRPLKDWLNALMLNLKEISNKLNQKNKVEIENRLVWITDLLLSIVEDGLKTELAKINSTDPSLGELEKIFQRALAQVSKIIGLPGQPLIERFAEVVEKVIELTQLISYRKLGYERHSV